MEERFKIQVQSPTDGDVMELLNEHLASMASISPPESKHALSVEGLRDPRITFWTLRQDDQLCGCGAIFEIDPTHAEIKSMRTHSQFLRQGVASRILEHIVSESKLCGYERLSLETGSQIQFAPARSLYERFGFTICGPFAQYRLDPNSVFMTREL